MCNLYNEIDCMMYDIALIQEATEAVVIKVEVDSFVYWLTHS